jgi:DNA-binding response OmpR family regulator
VLLLGPDHGAEERVRALTVGADDFLVWPAALE